MKRNTPRHKKMHALAAQLGVKLYAAVGVMEMLWHYAAQHTPEGDIGSVSDAEIAAAVAWDKAPSKLIDGLVNARWVERDDAHRLIIHDWPDHCEQSVKKWLDRNRKTFLPVYGRLPDAGHPADSQKPDDVQASRGLGLAGQFSEISEPSIPENPSTRARTEIAATCPPELNPVNILAELRDVYAQGGAPIPGAHENLAIQYLLNIPLERRARVANYCKWAFVSGKWPSPAKTKGLLNVLRDGDWDVELTQRTLPQSTAIAQMTAPQRAQTEAERQFRERKAARRVV